MAGPSQQSNETPSTSKQSQDRGRLEDLSLVEYFGCDAGFCGYCKKSAKETGVGRQSHNLTAYRLTAADYQDMIDTNWRRSGNYCYNPINISTCCPNYPIICKALDFVLSRSQRKCIKTMNSFLATGDPKSHLNLDYAFRKDGISSQTKTSTRPMKPFEEIRMSSKAKERRFVRTCDRKVRLHNISLYEAINQVREKWANRKPIRPTPALEDYLYPTVEAMTEQDFCRFRSKHKLVIDMHHVDSDRSRKLRETEHSVLVQYQRSIHKETSKEWEYSRYCDFLVVSPLITEPLKNFDYLTGHDKEEKAFDNLAVDVGAENASEYLLVKPPALPTAYGTYHCCYHLDEKLIAVGVLDVLPKCITTVYLFYDPKYAFLNLGIYSALVEISMLRLMNHHVLDRTLNNPLTDYYLGFYVHECKKMRYKTTFKPSYMLCSKTHQYVPTEVCLRMLMDKKYAVFGDDTKESDKSNKQLDLSRIVMQIQIEPPTDLPVDSLTNYIASIHCTLGPRYSNLLLEGWLIPYAEIIGNKLLPRLVIRLDGIHRHLIRRHERLTKSDVNQVLPSYQAAIE